MPVPAHSNPLGACKVFEMQPNTSAYASGWQCNGVIFTLNTASVVGDGNTPLVTINRGRVKAELHGTPRLLSLALILGSGATGGTNDPVSLVILDGDCRIMGASVNSFPGATAGQNIWRFDGSIFLNTFTVYRAVTVRTEIAATLQRGDVMQENLLQRIKLGTNGIVNWQGAALDAGQTNLNFLGSNTRLSLHVSGNTQYTPRALITLSQF